MNMQMTKPVNISEMEEDVTSEQSIIWQQERQQQIVEKTKTLVKTKLSSSSKGYANAIILTLIISFVTVMITIIMYLYLK